MFEESRPRCIRAFFFAFLRAVGSPWGQQAPPPLERHPLQGWLVGLVRSHQPFLRPGWGGRGPIYAASLDGRPRRPAWPAAVRPLRRRGAGGALPAGRGALWAAAAVWGMGGEPADGSSLVWAKRPSEGNTAPFFLCLFVFVCVLFYVFFVSRFLSSKWRPPPCRLFCLLERDRRNFGVF